MKSSEIFEDRKYVLRIKGLEVVCEVTKIEDGAVHYVWNRSTGRKVVPVRGVLARWEFAMEALRDLGAIDGALLGGDG